MAKPTKPETALVPYAKGTAVANLTDLVADARDLADKSLSEGTRKLYAECWGKYVVWCDANSMPPLPSAPGTLALYFTWLVKGQQGNTDRGRYGQDYVVSNSRLSYIWSAICHYHNEGGYPLAKIMRDATYAADPREREHWAYLKKLRDGARRTLAETKTVRRVRPITDLEVRDMIENIRPNHLLDARDAAILAIGFGGCRRRSEVVALDYLERGKTKGSKGYITITDQAVILHIQSSKTNKTGKEEQYPIYRQHARILVQAVEEWIRVSKPKPGEPLFKAAPRMRGTAHSSRPQSGYKGVYWAETKQGKGAWQAWYMEGGKRKFLDAFDDPRKAHLAICKKTGAAPHDPFDPSLCLKGRLDGRQVAEIVKNRYRQLRRQKYGKKLTPEQQEALDAAADEVSGHSLRAGHITTAASNGVPDHAIQMQSGHATTAMVAVYTRIQSSEKTSSQRGMRLS